MKFECKGNTLVKITNQVSKARSKNQTQSYLQDIYLSLEDHLLTLRATNLSITCEKSVSVKGIQNGSCILKGETFVKIVSLIQNNEDNFVCELIDGVFSITSDKKVIEIKTTPFEDFPTLPNEGDSIGDVSVIDLLSLIRDVSFCSATTEIKPEISSVFIYTKDGNIISVATDSYRLAEKTLPNRNSLDLSVLIPQKHIADIISILSEEEGDISLYKNEGLLTMNTESLSLCIHVTTGQFPDYKQLYPKEFTTVCSLNKDELQKSLTLTTYFTEQYSKVLCVFGGENLTLHSKNEQIGQVTNTVTIKKEGEDIEVAYNNRYFLDVFSHLVGNEISLSFTTTNRPVFIKSKEDISFTYLLMPLNR